MKNAPCKSTPQSELAYLSFDLALDGAAGVGLLAPKRIKVLPAGRFSSVDGRPANMEGITAVAWELNDMAAARLMADFRAKQLDMVVDYDHQTLRAEENGKPVPAAGWITALEYVPLANGNADAAGIWAQVTWTEDGAEYIANKEYRYLSPVFSFDPVTGVVGVLAHVALTNNPGLNMLPALVALKQIFNPPSVNAGAPPQESIMDKAQVLAALGLPADTSDATALTAIASLSVAAKTAATKDEQIVALTAKQFDPAKHIPLEEHKKVAEALAALTAEQDKAAHAALMASALQTGCILPPNEAYWRAQPLAALQAFLKDAKPLAVLGATQTGGREPPGVGNGAAQLNAEELAVCSQLGLSPEQFVKGVAK